MGLFDSFVNAMNETAKKNYKSATGRNYDRDFQEYLEDWERKCEWNGDYTLRNRWSELEDDNGIRHAAEKAAVRELMKEKGFDIY